MAPSVGLEPTTDRLTADSSTIELTGHIALDYLSIDKLCMQEKSDGIKTPD